MLHEFVLLGGVLFWIIVGFVGLIITVEIHNEKVGQATFTFLAAIAALILLTNAPKLLAGTPPIDYLYAFLGYLAIAAVWALIKWRLFFLPNLFRAYNDLREEFLTRKKLDEMPTDPAVLKEFKGDYQVERLNINYNRMVRHNKSRITTWMLYWPFSLLETFVGDFLANLFDRIYRSIAGLLQRMSDGMASKYSELN